jgi:hypothetical protein
MPPNEKWWIVLADFGAAKWVEEGNVLTTPVKGTNAFKRPVLLRAPDFPRPADIPGLKAADM